MIGLFTEFRPKFVHRYAEVAQTIEAAISAYASDVRARRFPAPEHVFSKPRPGG
jgi:3-methyl-2-oxobutanoate hydroxymethyltransferase